MSMKDLFRSKTKRNERKTTTLDAVEKHMLITNMIIKIKYKKIKSCMMAFFFSFKGQLWGCGTSLVRDSVGLFNLSLFKNICPMNTWLKIGWHFILKSFSIHQLRYVSSFPFLSAFHLSPAAFSDLLLLA